jgi:hypothetical protein
MGQCLQVIHTFKNNLAGGGFEALAAGSGDSLQVPNFVQGSQGHLLEMWGDDSVGPAEFDVRSPDFHDNTRGIRVAYKAQPDPGRPRMLMPSYIKQPLYRSDVLVAEVSGVAADKVSLDFLSYYENLEGADQRLLSWVEVDARGVDMVGIRISPTAGAAGDYGASVALNSADARLKANTDYAILGASFDRCVDVLAFTAPETSGRLLGLPGLEDAATSAGWFVELSNRYGLPLIPVVNSNNAGNVQFKVADAKGATAPAVDLVMVELA